MDWNVDSFFCYKGSVIMFKSEFSLFSPINVAVLSMESTPKSLLRVSDCIMRELVYEMKDED